MQLKRIAAPAIEPVSLPTAKAHLRVTHTAEDALIPIYISAAVSKLDGKDGLLGRAMITQNWQLSLDKFPCDGVIEFPLPPLQEVTFVKYFDSDNVEQTIDASLYRVDFASEPARLFIDSGEWPETYGRPNAINIEFICGYGDDPDDVPASLRAAMLLHIGDLFENRQTGQAQDVYQNPAYDSLTYPYRLLSI